MYNNTTHHQHEQERNSGRHGRRNRSIRFWTAITMLCVLLMSVGYYMLGMVSLNPLPLSQGRSILSTKSHHQEEDEPPVKVAVGASANPNTSPSEAAASFDSLGENNATAAAPSGSTFLPLNSTSLPVTFVDEVERLYFCQGTFKKYSRRKRMNGVGLVVESSVAFRMACPDLAQQWEEKYHMVRLPVWVFHHPDQQHHDDVLRDFSSSIDILSPAVEKVPKDVLFSLSSFFEKDDTRRNPPPEQKKVIAQEYCLQQCLQRYVCEGMILFRRHRHGGKMKREKSEYQKEDQMGAWEYYCIWIASLDRFPSLQNWISSLPSSAIHMNSNGVGPTHPTPRENGNSSSHFPLSDSNVGKKGRGELLFASSLYVWAFQRRLLIDDDDEEEEGLQSLKRTTGTNEGEVFHGETRRHEENFKLQLVEAKIMRRRRPFSYFSKQREVDSPSIPTPQPDIHRQWFFQLKLISTSTRKRREVPKNIDDNEADLLSNCSSPVQRIVVRFRASVESATGVSHPEEKALLYEDKTVVVVKAREKKGEKNFFSYCEREDNVVTFLFPITKEIARETSGKWIKTEFYVIKPSSFSAGTNSSSFTTMSNGKHSALDEESKRVHSNVKDGTASQQHKRNRPSSSVLNHISRTSWRFLSSYSFQANHSRLWVLPTTEKNNSASWKAFLQQLPSSHSSPFLSLLHQYYGPALQEKDEEEHQKDTLSYASVPSHHQSAGGHVNNDSLSLSQRLQRFYFREVMHPRRKYCDDLTSTVLMGRGKERWLSHISSSSSKEEAMFGEIAKPPCCPYLRCLPPIMFQLFHGDANHSLALPVVQPNLEGRWVQLHLQKVEPGNETLTCDVVEEISKGKEQDEEGVFPSSSPFDDYLVEIKEGKKAHLQYGLAFFMMPILSIRPLANTNTNRSSDNAEGAKIKRNKNGGIRLRVCRHTSRRGARKGRKIKSNGKDHHSTISSSESSSRGVVPIEICAKIIPKDNMERQVLKRKGISSACVQMPLELPLVHLQEEGVGNTSTKFKDHSSASRISTARVSGSTREVIMGVGQQKFEKGDSPSPPPHPTPPPSVLPILISLTVHECLPCLDQLVENIAIYAQPSIIVLHVSNEVAGDDSAHRRYDGRRNNNLSSFKQNVKARLALWNDMVKSRRRGKMGRQNSSEPSRTPTAFVYLNPETIPTRQGVRLLFAHISNLRFLTQGKWRKSDEHRNWRNASDDDDIVFSSRCFFSHVLFMASNELFVKPGVVRYMQQFDLAEMDRAPSSLDAGLVYEHFNNVFHLHQAIMASRSTSNDQPATDNSSTRRTTKKRRVEKSEENKNNDNDVARLQSRKEEEDDDADDGFASIPPFNFFHFVSKGDYHNNISPLGIHEGEGGVAWSETYDGLWPFLDYDVHLQDVWLKKVLSTLPDNDHDDANTAEDELKERNPIFINQKKKKWERERKKNVKYLTSFIFFEGTFLSCVLVQEILLPSFSWYHPASYLDHPKLYPTSEVYLPMLFLQSGIRCCPSSPTGKYEERDGEGGQQKKREYRYNKCGHRTSTVLWNNGVEKNVLFTAKNNQHQEEEPDKVEGKWEMLNRGSSPPDHIATTTNNKKKKKEKPPPGLWYVTSKDIHQAQTSVWDVPFSLKRFRREATDELRKDVMQQAREWWEKDF